MAHGRLAGVAPAYCGGSKLPIGSLPLHAALKSECEQIDGYKNMLKKKL
jgi:hypothetical protein